MISIALSVSGVALVVAVLAGWQARRSQAAAAEATRRAAAAQDRLVALDIRLAELQHPHIAAEPTAYQLITAALDDGERLSNACHAVARAFDDGGEPPGRGDYVRVRRCADLLTASVARMRDPQHGDTVRELTDELVTVHHAVLTEVTQHENARFPFVGAKDTALLNVVLNRFDAELNRLRLYQQTGVVPQPQVHLVDFDTIRFVPRGPGASPPLPG